MKGEERDGRGTGVRGQEGRFPPAWGTLPRRLLSPGARQGHRSSLDPGEGGSRLRFSGSSRLPTWLRGEHLTGRRGAEAGRWHLPPPGAFLAHPSRCDAASGADANPGCGSAREPRGRSRLRGAQVRAGNMASLSPRAGGCREQVFFTRLKGWRCLLHRPGTGSWSCKLGQGHFVNLRRNPNRTREIKTPNYIPGNIPLYSNFQHDYSGSEDSVLV